LTLAVARPQGVLTNQKFDTCSCQTARCFNKSKGVLITGSKLKAFRNPQPSWGFSVHKEKAALLPPSF
ncbi:hypothetical protein, partial [Escherichia coli]|uniref:hypothetical protein n=1 Tax=Escherichia coli TaxID=562 RepID=UPI001BCBD0D1